MIAEARAASSRRSDSTYVPMPGRHTVSQHFNHAAQRIGGLLGLVDAFDDAGFGLFVQRTDRRGIKRFQIVGGGQRQVGVGLHATKRHHVATVRMPNA